MRIETEEQLEELLARPSAADQDLMRRMTGDVIVVGAAGKMGPSLVRRVRRAADAASVKRRVLAVSRFSSPHAREDLEREGIETIACDLLDAQQVAKLPECENVFFLAGRKFGSTDRSDLTWATNTLAVTHVAGRFRSSRIVVFSTGNVYPLVPLDSGGSLESDAPDPVGEYAQSALGRERLAEYFSREFGTRCLLFRLNYAVDLRYGVLVDIARRVYEKRPVDLTIPRLNAIWQGDANSYALRSLELCASPPEILNVTGPECISVHEAADFYAQRFARLVSFRGTESPVALLSNASRCHRLLGAPQIRLEQLLEMVAHWIEIGGTSLNKPTKFEVIDGRF
jgi:nucleoside-diphosphate-sugar epimerase